MSVQSPISSVNDFVVRFANVNGSGSASRGTAYSSGASAGDPPKPGPSGDTSRSPAAVRVGASSVR